jgi:branched-chain amino acid transport system ATP-binding protein
VALLRTAELTVRFGGVRALDGVDVTIERGGIVGLIGPNGGGKTTFIDAVSGVVPLSSGRVTFRGEDITGAPPFERANRGLVRTFQTLELYEDLTVEQNLVAGAEPTPWWRFLADAVRPGRSAVAVSQVDEVLRLVGLEGARHRRPAELSHGHRRLVALGRALAAAPHLLLLDEPAAGLDTLESRALADVLRTVAESGITILLVDHDMTLVLDVCHHVYVLDFGSVIAAGPPDEIRRDPAVVAAYLGATTE